MRTKAIVVPLLTGLAVALAAYAQELKSADGIFNFSTAKTTSYKTWSGDIVQTMNTFGSEVTTKGSITRKQPRKMRMQMDMPMMGAGAAGGRPSQPAIPPPPQIPPRQCPTQRLTTFGSHCRKVVASRIHLISERFLACCHLLGVTSGNLSTVE